MQEPARTWRIASTEHLSKLGAIWAAPWGHLTRVNSTSETSLPSTAWNFTSEVVVAEKPSISVMDENFLVRAQQTLGRADGSMERSGNRTREVRVG